MSKYDALWAWIRLNGEERFCLSFDEIGRIAGLPLDHAFLRYKKKLETFGYRVRRISMKEKYVAFERLTAEEKQA